MAKRPRVVTVALDLSPSHGGMYRAVSDVARMLDAPIVSFRDGSGPLPCGALDVPVEVIDCSDLSLVRRALWPTSRMRAALARALTGAEIVVVHSLFRAHVLLANDILRHTGTPYVVLPHGALTPSLWRSRALARRMWMAAGGTRAVREAACVVFATQAERDGGLQTLGWEPYHEIIPFAVDVVPAAAGAGDARESARRELGLPLGRRLIVVLGRLDAVKRPREIVEGFLVADPPGCNLVIAGPDGTVDAEGLRAGIPTHRRENVHLLGPLEPRRRDLLLAAGDVYLSWSRHESFGYAAAEAMAQGLPVILSPGNALQPELLALGCGIFPADDPASLQEALRRCAAWTQGDCEALGAAGRRWVQERLNNALVAFRWRQLIERLTLHR